MNRRTIVGMPALEPPGAVAGALPDAELAEVPAPWMVEAESFDMETYRAMVRAEDDAQFRRLCQALMADMLRERQERREARTTMPPRRKRRRVPGVVVGAGVAIVTALATFGLMTSLLMR